jgi:ABC-type xylose transport system permease subunit
MTIEVDKTPTKGGGRALADLSARVRAASLEQFRALTLVGVLLVIWLVFQVMTNGLFLSPRNLTTLTVQVAVTAILAAGIVMVMVPGQIDLSIGSAVCLTGMIAALIVDSSRGLGWTENPAIVIALTILSGVIIGAWQGAWVAWMRVPSFIVTLASLLALRGASLTVTGGSTASHKGTLSFIAAEFIPAPWTLAAMVVIVAGFALIKQQDYRARVRARVSGLSYANIVVLPVVLMLLFGAAVTAIAFSYRGTPLPVGILALVVLFVSFVMARTAFGRRLYAIGGNPLAARYAGINMQRHIFLVFVFMGVLYGIAGLILLSRIGVAVPTAGTGLELTVIASAVIGGTSLFGGTGTAVGAVIGALLLESLNNGMGLMNIESSFQLIVNGLVLLVAVYFDIRGRRLK